MFHITNLFQSFAACFSTSTRRQPTAIEAIKRNVTKYQNARPLSSSEQSTATMATNVMVIEHTLEEQPHDIIEAEMKWGISFFRDYSGYKVEDHSLSRIILSARYQKNPMKMRFVSCPKVIYAHDLGQENRDLLRIKLDAVVRLIPWNKLEERFQIKRDDWFIVSDVPEGIQETLQKGL
ncbi:hypothetical protein BDV40DRAFT_273772 [Aspergillus tamarii]|uniref:Uncharacterized protein n=1 Tax=Aspergillus tamarii TaxID=41984 RepID=A0A5N6UKX5_ASPTM|nr:hypothetical protein BDV40DRAFT_273772 [Aspergillus tamarii]